LQEVLGFNCPERSEGKALPAEKGKGRQIPTLYMRFSQQVTSGHLKTTGSLDSASVVRCDSCDVEDIVHLFLEPQPQHGVGWLTEFPQIDSNSSFTAL
jgi:hypothetical protein